MKGTIYQRSPGSYRIQWYVGRDPVTGRHRYENKTVRGNLRDAQRELRRILTELDSGHHIRTPKQTLATYLRYWLTAYAKPNLAGRTYARYAEIIERVIIPALGDHPLDKLAPSNIQAWLAKCSEAKRDATGPPSPQTVLKYHRVLSKALSDAVRLQMLNRNPCASVIPPKQTRGEAKALNIEQLRALIAAAQGTVWYLPILLAASTGMRRGEVLALRWEDVDLDRRVIHVRRSLEQVGTELAYKEPKTAKSRRLIDIPAGLAVALSEHNAIQKQRKIEFEEVYQDEGLIVCREDGVPLKPDSLSRNFRRFIHEKGLPAISYHGLRHTHATLLVMDGVPVKIVSDRLGHSSVNLTLDTYTHSTLIDQRAAVDSFDALLSPGKQCQNNAKTQKTSPDDASEEVL